MKKNVIIIMMMMFTIIMYSQKKKAGTVYSEHPAIDAVEAMVKAWVAGDADKVASFLSENFKSFDGTSTNKDAKGRTKENFVNGVKNFHKNFAHVSITRSPGATPDALEYKDDVLWVQTWDHFKAVHNETGVKVDMPVHRMYAINKDNKIVTLLNYDNDLPWAEMRRSFVTRTNGVLYDHHENINKVRRMMAALENGDAEKGFSYFTEKARFTNLDMPRGESATLEEEKEGFMNMLEKWNIESIDVNGYPDYLEYERSGKVVQSWWTVRMARKSDGKKVIIPLLLIHDFNDDGMIINESGYYTLQALED
jgi:hypothetical protein